MLRIHVDPWFLRAGSNSPSAKRPMKNQVPGTIPVWAQVICMENAVYDLNWFFIRIAHMFPAPTYLDLGAMSSSWGELRWTPPPKFRDDPMILAGHTLSFWTRPHAGSAGQMSTQKLKTHVPGQGCDASGILSITGPFNNKHWDLAMRIATKHEREAIFFATNLWESS